MRQNWLIALVGMLAVLLGSCGGEEAPPPTASSPSPSASATPSPSQAASPSASPTTAATGPFSSPPVVAQQPAKEPAVPGLVQPTNPEARLPQVQKGRKDPFALIPVQPVVKVSPTTDQESGGVSEVPKPVPSLPAIPQPPSLTIGGGAATLPNPVRKPSGGQQSPNAIARRSATPSKPPVAANPAPRKTPVSRGQNVAANPRPQATPRIVTTPLPPSPPSFRPELPKLPEPTLAESVEVSGVVKVGERPQAIVKAPNEPSSRYVTEGQRLANGQVLVKRIEMNEGSNPVVILEQYGIEVARGVGEKAGPTSPQQPGRPAAAVPLAAQKGAA